MSTEQIKKHNQSVIKSFKWEVAKNTLIDMGKVTHASLRAGRATWPLTIEEVYDMMMDK